NNARLAPACAIIGISVRTYQRWVREGSVQGDRRPIAVRSKPSNALTQQERQAVVDICTQEEYADLPPGQIVPRLADKGVYIASESTMYRVLRDEGLQHHRGRAKPPSAPKPPTTHCASQPHQIFCWDITWLPGPIRGQFFFLYLIIDLFSRKIVGWEVHDSERGEHASALVERTVWRERCVDKPLVLHGDNGSPLKGATVQTMLAKLGITASFSRPRVSNDNAYAESIFRHLKYAPAFPRNGFASLEAARDWVYAFVLWYNTQHRHRGINYVTPQQRLLTPT
ncbi:MAG: IS3 family transposase, partial [Lamprobacter sp.]|uniref:IS3 family transposase n=1 Tax=Lamprobacter sp. TaxID=3100796 RepID=UPI002B264047